MSETERRKGQLLPVKMDFAKVLELIGEEYPLYYNKDRQSDWEACLLEHDLNYICLKGKWYNLVEEKQNSYDDFCEVDVRENGIINFHAQYYNGGTCLRELLEEALND